MTQHPPQSRIVSLYYMFTDMCYTGAWVQEGPLTQKGVVHMPTITIRLTDETRARVTEAAEARGVPVSDLIRGAIEADLALEPSGTIGTDRPEDEVTLTVFQRKVLQLLHRNLLATQQGGEDTSHDPEEDLRALEILEPGFAGEYHREFSDITGPMTQDECELMWDIFDMFRVIQGSVRELGDEGWSQIHVEDAERHGTFRGFDFNRPEEIRLSNYAEFLVEDGRWTEQKEAFSRENDGGNSHSRMLPRYRAMLRVFKPMWSQIVRGGSSRGVLSAEDVERILLASPGARATGQ